MSQQERVLLCQTGWDKSLRYERLDTQPPGPSGAQVLVRVEACGVCHRDLIDRSGRFAFIRLPIVPGHEAAGRVAAIGPEVTDFQVGDPVGTLHRDACGQCQHCRAGETSLCESAAAVLGLLSDGGYASHLLLPQSGLYPLPADATLSAAQAAVLHCTFGTAYRDLVTLGHLRVGERLLVTGANGGVGAAAVQLGRRLGAEVIASVRNAEHEDFVRAQGASEVLLLPAAPPPGSIDLALDTVGQPTLLLALRSLRLGGRLVVVGNVVPEKVAINLGALITRAVTIIGGSGATRQDMAELLKLHRQTPFMVPIAEELPLSEAEAAQRHLRQGSIKGRLALIPSLRS